MTQADLARHAAVHFEAKKTGFGQAQDGWSLTLRIQEIDLPPTVRDARKGTRYMVALVELNDDETPKLNEVPSSPHTGPTASSDEVPSGEGMDSRRSWDQLPYVTRAGILCSDDDFKDYVSKVWPGSVTTEDFLRCWCEVQSRTQIDGNSVAERKFNEIRERFITWRDYERGR